MKERKRQNEIIDIKLLFYWKILIYINLFLFFILLAIVFSYSQWMLSDANSARYLISALIQSEAAIFAIVITLSLVVIQQSASSFSPRVIEVFKNFKKNPDFYIIIVIYIGVMLYSALILKVIDDSLTNSKIDYNNLDVIKTIGNDIFSLQIVENNYNFSIQTCIWTTYFLAFFAFVSLIQYIRRILELLNPSNIIRMLSVDITAENLLASSGFELIKPCKYRIFASIKCWNEIKSNLSKGNPRFDSDNNPLLPLIDIIRGSLMRYDYETAMNGLKTIEYKIKQLIENDDFEHTIYSEYLSKYIFEDMDFEQYDGSKNFEEYNHYLIKKMYGNIFNQLERIGQVAITNVDYHSTNEVISVVFNCVTKIFEKDKINPQMELIIGKGLHSLEIIGITASKQKMENIVIEAARAIRKIGNTSIQKDIRSIAIDACEIETELRPDTDGSWINKGDVLFKFGRNGDAIYAYDKAIDIKESYSAYNGKAKAWDEINAGTAKKYYDKASLMAHDEMDNEMFRSL